MRHADLLVKPGERVRLAAWDPGFTAEFESKADAQQKLADDLDRLADLQDVFYAAQSCAVLIIFQGMDSAGKDGAIRHVMSALDPQGVDVHSFKEPSVEERRHDFLWRAQAVLPERGRFGIFNRSYYEDVVVVRVHPELLEPEGVTDPPKRSFWKGRCDDINAFERHLTRSGTIVLKFFLHLSRGEQLKRLLERVDDPKKNWKFSPNDVRERKFWTDYVFAYEQALHHTSTPWAPWHVIPADHKWFTRTAIADVLVAKLKSLKLRYPRAKGKAQRLLAKVRAQLKAEAGA